MNRSVLLFLFPVLILLLSCNSTSTEPDSLIEGEYEGVFMRSADNVRPEPINVKLTLEDGKFYGEGFYICKGSYSIENKKIIFHDECVWTANFDWTYILSGEYNFSNEGYDLALTRSYDSEHNTTDSYLLTRIK